MVSRECPRGGNLPAPPGGSFFGGGFWGGSRRLQPCSSFLGGGFAVGSPGVWGLWCLGGRAGAACGVGLGLVGWGGGWGGGVAPLGGVFGVAAGVWCPFRALLRVPPILFRFFCCSVPYVMYVAELQSCAGLVGPILWLLPLASGGLLLCGVVLGGCWWVGCFCGCLVFVGWLGLWVSGCLSVLCLLFVPPYLPVCPYRERW